MFGLDNDGTERRVTRAAKTENDGERRATRANFACEMDRSLTLKKTIVFFGVAFASLRRFFFLFAPPHQSSERERALANEGASLGAL